MESRENSRSSSAIIKLNIKEIIKSNPNLFQNQLLASLSEISRDKTKSNKHV